MQARNLPQKASALLQHYCAAVTHFWQQIIVLAHRIRETGARPGLRPEQKEPASGIFLLTPCLIFVSVSLSVVVDDIDGLRPLANSLVSDRIRISVLPREQKLSPRGILSNAARGSHEIKRLALH